VELIIFVAALFVMGVAARRWGHDSRLPPDSKEQDVASLGLLWERDSTTLRSAGAEAPTTAARPVPALPGRVAGTVAED
jgi:hypothetical protein